jgi:hypothetical protein
VSVAAVRSPAEFEERLQRYLFERAEEGRAVRVGEKETSEQAAIVARYDDLFSREQLDLLRECEQAAEGDERERLFRLRKTCEAGIATSELAEEDDEVENRILAARVTWKGEELPIRSAQARLAVIDSYAERAELGKLAADRNAEFNQDRVDLLAKWIALDAELSGIPDPIERTEDEKGISLRDLARELARANDKTEAAYAKLRDKWFDRLLGPEREQIPASYHSAYMRRLSPLQATYPKEGSVEICMDTLTQLGFDLENEQNIRLDLDDRPQKNPRACVIASDPPRVVHLITRAQGGLHDYQAFLHEAGHALHYAGCDPSLSYTFRRLARDNALTEIYSFLLESITRLPAWHAKYFDLSHEQAAENASGTELFEVLLFRRYVAKLQYELDFWGRYNDVGATPEGYADRLTNAVGLRYREDHYIIDMDPGFYVADYLRAWIRSAQLRAYLRREVGEDWWARKETGDHLRSLFLEGTRPSSEEIAERIGFDPLDTGPLVSEMVH